MGFVPLAYRAGSTLRRRSGQGARVHIFWQKRIREGDRETPWWFPSQTTGGAIREDRLVLPIPPGTHWSDAKPVILPALSAVEGPGIEASAGEPKALPAPRKAKERPPVVAKRTPLSGGLCFAPPESIAPAAAACPERSRGENPFDTAQGRKPEEKKPRRKNDPRLVTAARELKDRWLEHVNAGGMLIDRAGKYDVSRTLSAVEGTRILPTTVPAIRALPAAA